MPPVPNKQRSLAAIVGAAVASALLLLTPAWEGTVLKTYADIGGVLTYCTGATDDAIWGKTYTVAECRAQLDKDLAAHAEGVMACVKVPLTDNQKVAFVDAAYNIGVNNFCNSSMARRANAGDMPGACSALLMWNKIKGQVVRGLDNRRKADYAICIKGM